MPRGIIINRQKVDKRGVKKLKAKRFAFVIPIMSIVLVVAIWMLNESYSGIKIEIRLMIALGAALLSGVDLLFSISRE